MRKVETSDSRQNELFERMKEFKELIAKSQEEARNKTNLAMAYATTLGNESQ